MHIAVCLKQVLSRGSHLRVDEPRTWVRESDASWELNERLQYALESQALASELQMETSLGRSLRFGRVAGSVIVLCRLGRISADEARAILVAGDDRRSNIGRLWDRFSVTYLRNE